MGLIDTEALESTTEALTPSERSLTPPEGSFDPPLTPGLPPDDPPLPLDEKAAKEKQSSGFRRVSRKNGENAVLGGQKSGSSYSSERRTEPLVAAGREGR